MEEKLRILVIDDNQLFVESISALLEAREGVESVFSASDLDQAMKLASSTPVDMVLIGPNLSWQSALDLAWELKERMADLKVIALGLEPNEDKILQFIEAGASNYLLKGESCQELMRTIMAVQRGQALCSDRVAASVFSRLNQLSQGQGQDLQPDVELTPREEDVLRLIAGGLTNKEIGERLSITLCTVKNHVHNILDKFQVHYRQEAVRCGYENGLLKGSWPRVHLE